MNRGIEIIEVINAASKILWGTVTIIFGLAMAFKTGQPVWMWGVIIGGVFFGIRTLGAVAQSYAAALTSMVPSPISRIELANSPELSSTSIPPNQPLGGSVDEFTSLTTRGLTISLKTLVIVILALLVAVCIGIQVYKQPKLLSGAKDVVPIGDTHIIRATNKGFRITDRAGNVTEVKRVRGRDQIIEIDKSGHIKTDKVAGWFPFFTLIPHLDMLATAKTIEPAIGLQVIRSEEPGIGGNVVVGAKSVGISLTKDIFTNSMAGISYTWEYEGTGTPGVVFGLYF